MALFFSLLGKPIQMETKRITKLKWWQVALISVAVSSLGSLSSLLSSKRQTKLYTTQLRQAPWAPPSWVFAPAWILNNFFLIKALGEIMERNIPEKRKLLLLQAGIWAIFFSFGFVYFKKKSPILAGVWTMSDSVLAIASLVIAAKSNRKISLYFLPLTLWTVFASTVAGYQALKNPDPIFGSKALA
jgi:translocator protein